MTSKQRFLAALDHARGSGPPDRLPVTTHHVMSSYLAKHQGGASPEQFFDRFGLDPIIWTVPHKPMHPDHDYPDPEQENPGFLESRRVASEGWRIFSETMPDSRYATTRYRIETPGGTLTTVLQANEDTTWVSEQLVKHKSDLDIIAAYATVPACDVDAVNQTAEAYGDRGLVRGHICCFDIFGQPGCWQDACCLFGTEALIMATYDDPAWVKEFLDVLVERKIAFARSLEGANYDVLELGGGDASTTVISPAIFHEYVAPYDSRIIRAAQDAGQRISYHTCGGMMPVLEAIAAMGPTAMETFTPSAMGGDTDLAAAKQRVGDKVCMIGGFDQYHYFTSCTPDETRKEVRRCFEAAGEGGGYILCPSDHFFEAEDALVEAFVDEATQCVYC